MKAKAFREMLVKSFFRWQADKASRMAAALAYYAIFSIAPLLIIVIAITGFVFGEAAARGEMVAQMQSLVGAEAAAAIEAMIQNASRFRSGLTATLIGIVSLLFGASGVFTELQSALDTIWEVTPKGSWRDMIKSRFFSFLMVLGIGILLLASVVASTMLTALASLLRALLPAFAYLHLLLNVLLPFVIITLLFAVTYKTVPDVKIAWRDVWTGAAISSFLFTVAKLVLGIYLTHSRLGSAYGAAGSLMVLLFWVYFSAQIFLFGAEFTRVHANHFGSRCESAQP